MAREVVRRQRRRPNRPLMRGGGQSTGRRPSADGARPARKSPSRRGLVGEPNPELGRKQRGLATVWRGRGARWDSGRAVTRLTHGAVAARCPSRARSPRGAAVDSSSSRTPLSQPCDGAVADAVATFVRRVVKRSLHAMKASFSWSGPRPDFAPLPAAAAELAVRRSGSATAPCRRAPPSSPGRPQRERHTALASSEAGGVLLFCKRHHRFSAKFSTVARDRAADE